MSAVFGLYLFILQVDHRHAGCQSASVDHLTHAGDFLRRRLGSRHGRQQHDIGQRKGPLQGLYAVAHREGQRTYLTRLLVHQHLAVHGKSLFYRHVPYTRSLLFKPCIVGAGHDQDHVRCVLHFQLHALQQAYHLIEYYVLLTQHSRTVIRRTHCLCRVGPCGSRTCQIVARSRLHLLHKPVGPALLSRAVYPTVPGVAITQKGIPNISGCHHPSRQQTN